jgi:hypothetical protein
MARKVDCAVFVEEARRSIRTNRHEYIQEIDRPEYSTPPFLFVERKLRVWFFIEP